MKVSSFFVFVALLFLNSCKFSNHKDYDSLYRVNLERDINNIASVPLSYLGSKVEYVCLEAETDCILSKISKISVSESFLLVSDSYRLLEFDRSGRYIRLIGSQGRGPGEYDKIWDIAINEADREIFILSSGRKILVYDFDGKFIRDFVIGFPGIQFVLNENSELIIHQINIGQKSNEPVYSFHILTNHGKILTKIPNTLKRENGVAITNSPLYMYKGTLNFMEFGIDTLYTYDNNIKRPRILFQYGNLKFSTDPTVDQILKNDKTLWGKIYVNNIQETEKSLFIRISYLLPHISVSNCIYDKLSGRLTILKDDGFANDIDGGIPFWPETIINDSIMVDFADAYDLINSYKKDVKGTERSAHLENIINNLTETSNPVIMILYP